MPSSGKVQFVKIICPHCQAENNAVGPSEGNNIFNPEDHSFMICFYCAGFWVQHKEESHILSPEEWLELPDDERIHITREVARLKSFHEWRKKQVH